MQADTVENTKAANDETYDITKEKRSNAPDTLLENDHKDHVQRDV